MQINEKALKPCPFCGKDAQIAPDEIGSGGQHVPPYHAGCLRGAGCGIAFTADDPDEAIEEWNRRALTSTTSPDVAGLIERLEQAGDDYRDRMPATSSLFFRAATALRLSAGGGWRCPNTGHVYSASDLASLMERRDMFIVSRGLWGEFAAALDAFPVSPTTEAGHD